MGNMGYCRFQNTSGDLQDCWDDVLSDSEQEAKKEIIELCRDIIAHETDKERG